MIRRHSRTHVSDHLDSQRSGHDAVHRTSSEVRGHGHASVVLSPVEESGWTGTRPSPPRSQATQLSDTYAGPSRGNLSGKANAERFETIHSAEGTSEKGDELDMVGNTIGTAGHLPARPAPREPERDLKCLGTTARGEPRHPFVVPRSTAISPYRRPVSDGLSGGDSPRARCAATTSHQGVTTLPSSSAASWR